MLSYKNNCMIINSQLYQILFGKILVEGFRFHEASVVIWILFLWLGTVWMQSCLAHVLHNLTVSIFKATSCTWRLHVSITQKQDPQWLFSFFEVPGVIGREIWAGPTLWFPLLDRLMLRFFRDSLRDIRPQTMAVFEYITQNLDSKRNQNVIKMKEIEWTWSALSK